MLSIGLMSGTSMDGIDAALLNTDGKTAITELGNVFLPYSPELKILFKAIEYAARLAMGNLELAAQNFPATLVEHLKNSLGLPDVLIASKVKELASYFHQQQNPAVTFSQIVLRSTELHAEAVQQLLKKTGFTASEIDVIGYHGQTLLHKPANKISLQVGDGKLLAELTGITTVNDFRSRDIAFGGQGAPFAPLYHQALAVRDKKIPTAVINCGGIANITFITGEDPLSVVGFDTGPGNGLIDQCVRQATHGLEYMDFNGQYGLQGKVHNEMIAALYQHAVMLMSDNYFTRRPPKSLDIGDLYFLPKLHELSLPDACRTLAAFTADSIVEALHVFNKIIPKYIVLAGGGWNNPVIRFELETRLKRKIPDKIAIMTADEMGWNSQAMEAQVFAYLAVRSLLNLPISMPAITAVSQPLSGGIMHLSPFGPTEAVAKIL
ncbi:MAG: anhydro-N-acetylmuramic acid kinase [Pseudomonadota bacterium]